MAAKSTSRLLIRRSRVQVPAPSPRFIARSVADQNTSGVFRARSLSPQDQLDLVYSVCLAPQRIAVARFYDMPSNDYELSNTAESRYDASFIAFASLAVCAGRRCWSLEVNARA